MSSPAVEEAVERLNRVVLRPLPHHLCRDCNPARKRPFEGTCPGCGQTKGCQRCHDSGHIAEGPRKGHSPCDSCGREPEART